MTVHHADAAIGSLLEVWDTAARGVAEVGDADWHRPVDDGVPATLEACRGLVGFAPRLLVAAGAPDAAVRLLVRSAPDRAPSDGRARRPSASSTAPARPAPDTRT